MACDARQPLASRSTSTETFFQIVSESRNYKVITTSSYKGASLEVREYATHRNQAVVTTYGRDYIGSFNTLSTAKRAVTVYLKRGTPPA